MSKNIIVIGGGASGVVAAITAARNGAKVTVLEKKEQPLKKLSATGNGRGNLLNKSRDKEHFHSSSINQALNILGKVSNENILDFFYELGLMTKQKGDLYYPMSLKAMSITSALISEAKRLGVTIICNENVSDVIPLDNGFKIKCNDKEYFADAVIYSVGSPAGLSSKEKYTGRLPILKNHQFYDFKPALTALLSDDKICSYWNGIRNEARIDIYTENILVRSEYGELMLTDDGISGIAAFQLSHYYKPSCYVCIDFIPEVSDFELAMFIRKCKTNNRKLIEAVSGMLNSKLASSLITELTFREEAFKGKRAHELTCELNNAELIALTNILKNFKVNIKGVRGFTDSQVCSGGVGLMTINPESCESLKINGLFFTGEVLDMAGDCGGFNLMWAWVTGILAGKNASR